MKKILCFLFTTCLYSLSAQDSTAGKIKELYLSVSGVSPLNVRIQYKHQLARRTFFKAALINLNYSDNKSRNSSVNAPVNRSIGYSGGLGLGVEFRNSLYRPFSVFHGPNIGFSMNHTISKIKAPGIPEQSSSNTSYSSGLGYTLGFLFHLGRQFYLSAELSPGLAYTVNRAGANTTEAFNINLSNSGFLSVAYRF